MLFGREPRGLRDVIVEMDFSMIKKGATENTDEANRASDRCDRMIWSVELGEGWHWLEVVFVQEDGALSLEILVNDIPPHLSYYRAELYSFTIHSIFKSIHNRAPFCIQLYIYCCLRVLPVVICHRQNHRLTDSRRRLPASSIAPSLPFVSMQARVL